MLDRAAARNTPSPTRGVPSCCAGWRRRRDNPAFRSAPLLRVFLLDQLTAAAAAASTCSRCASTPKPSTSYEQIHESHDWTGGDDDFFGRAALEWGLRFTSMQADWATWVIEQLDRRKSP